VPPSARIGRAAGLTRGTIYNSVRPKGDILYLVCEEKAHTPGALARALRDITDPARRLGRTLKVLVEAIHAHEETVLLVYRESRRHGRVGMGGGRVVANILTFLPLVVAMRRWDFERQGVSWKTLDEHLVRLMLSGLGLSPVNGNGGPGGR